MSNDNNFSYAAIEEAIRSRKEELFPALRSNIQQRLSTMSSSEALTFRLLKGEKEIKRVVPSATKEYAAVLIRFCRGQSYDGYVIDSAVTPIVMANVESTLLSFFASPSIGESVADAISTQFSKQNPSTAALSQELGTNTEWLKTEVTTILNYSNADSIALQILDLASGQIQEFLASSIGKQLVVAITKMMATSAGKTFIIQTLRVAVAKVMASAALKAALISFLKKVGVGILIKSAIGKALIAMLAVAGLAHVPVLLVLVPLLAAFLIYEYNTFPAKLAAKIPYEVERIIREQFDLIAKETAKQIFKGVLAELAKQLTKVRISVQH